MKIVYQKFIPLSTWRQIKAAFSAALHLNSAVLWCFNPEGGGPRRKSELKIQIEGVPAGRSHVDVLCFDLVYFTRPAQFVILSAGVFFFYLLYGYYQELIFSLPGFAGYGWYLTLLQFGYYSLFGKVAPLNNLCCYVTLYVVDRDVFTSRREESAFENLHTSCLDNSSNYGVLKCKFRLLELSYPGTDTHHLKVDNIVFLGHLQMLQTYPSPDWGNIDPRQETWSIGLCGLWCHVSWSHPLHTCW